MVFPETIETVRLILRVFEPEDRDALVDIFGNWQVTKWLSTNVPFPYTAKDAEKFIAKAGAEFKEGSAFCYAIEDKKTGRLAGNIGIFSPTGEVEIGYALDPAFWGGGMGTEILKAMTNAAFKTEIITRIVAQTATNNIGSQKILEKVGFKHAGTPPPEHARCGHTEGCSEFYRLTIEDWQRKNRKDV
ncbi:hypothetical protein MNBD_ALPHA03-265 [hydrothermal vent metagenome]|uniref:N-acetyltransferase domain-containing protein n=1 Tax=hydrothermal vent metagenome TaxID=652676 RepID=A0A3B1B9W2_9ZZZZ